MGFAPTPGRVQLLDLSSGPGIRVDRGIATGDVIPPDFDSMVAKVIAHGRTRDEAIARLRRALRESTAIIEDGTTNRAFLLALLDRPEFRSGQVDVNWLDRLGVSGDMESFHGADVALLQAAIELADDETATDRASFYAYARRGRPHANAAQRRHIEVRHRGQAYRIAVSQLSPDRYRTEVDGVAVECAVERLSPHERRITIGGLTHRTLISRQGADLLVEVHGVPHRVTRDDGGLVRSHAPAVVVAIPVGEGDEVAEGEVVAIVESMKMETSLTAPFAGRVRRVLSGANVQVGAQTPLLQLEAIDDDDDDSGAERVAFTPCETVEEDGPRAPALAAARLRRQRRRGAPRARPGSTRARPTSTASTGCCTSTRTCARSPARATTSSASCCTARRSTCTRTCARSTRRPSACRSASRPTSSARSRTTASTGSSARRRSRTRATGCSSPSSAPTSPTRPCWRSSTRRLQHADELIDKVGPEFRDVLDRIESTAERRDPVIADLARQLRNRYYDQPLVAARRAAAYADVEEHLRGAVERRRATATSRRSSPRRTCSRRC